ncbi:hypothetical protein [Gallibacterium anatis]|uniref:hypothetical protein n=1 Tax=Gallibacterium anatis TaxID=750 RepID=UPI001E41268B|nr:hypothetical protein [Gallibacterium anatis]
MEKQGGLEPHNPDTNGDGTPDGKEDSDGDGKDNETEVKDGTDPFKNEGDPSAVEPDKDKDGIRDDVDTDIDGDGVNNADENAAGLDPRNPATDGTPDGDKDTDNDGLTNKEESNPNGSEPTDRDGNGKPDITDPKEDADNDGVSNKDEKDNGTDPNSTDTDKDGTPDGKDPVNNNDKDQDGINDADEKETGTNPENKDPENTDSDGDGVSDKDESDTTKPGMTDKDGDGVSDLTQPPQPQVNNSTKVGDDGVERYTGGVEIDPYGKFDDNAATPHVDKVVVNYTPEDGKDGKGSPTTMTFENVAEPGQADNWVAKDESGKELTPEELADKGITLDKGTGKITFSPDAVADDTKVSAQNFTDKAENPSAPTTITTKPDNYDADKELDNVDKDDDNDGLPDDKDPNPHETNTDQDGDGVNNADELEVGTDPTNPTSTTDKDGNPVKDGDLDSDNDGLTNEEESDPKGSKPTDRDGDENPDITDGKTDADGDGVNNADEKATKEDDDPSNDLDPHNPDSDGDKVPDGQEDTDGDGKTNKEESDPNGNTITDKDGDGITDINDKPSSVEIAAVAGDNIINAKEAAGDTIPVKVAVTFGDGDKANFASITVTVGDNQAVTIPASQLGTSVTENGKDVYTVNVPKTAFGEFKDGTVKVDLNLNNPKTNTVSSVASDDQAFTVDVKAPEVKAELSDNGTTDNKSDDKVVVTFPTDPDTKEVTVEYTPKDGSGPVTVTYTKDPDGNWTSSDPKAPAVNNGKFEKPVSDLLPGSDVLVNAKDNAGNEAQPEIVKVPQDFSANVEGVNPQAGDNAINAKEADGGIKVTVTPDPDKPFAAGDTATVTVKAKDGTGTTETYDAKVDADGNISVNIPKDPTTDGKKGITDFNGKDVDISVQVKPGTGSTTEEKEFKFDNVKVDLTAPESPKVEKMDGNKVEITPPTDGDVNSIDVVVTKPNGEQETATLTKDPEGNNWKSDNPNVPVTDTDSDGNPEITLKPGETAQIGVTDKAGNSSEPVTAFNPQSTVVSVSIDDDGVLNNEEINGVKDPKTQEYTTKPKDVPVTVAVKVPETEMVDTVNVKVGDKTYTYSSDPAKADSNTLQPAGTDKDGNQLYTANVPAGELKTAAGSETTGKVTAEVSVKPSVGGKVDPQTLPSKEGTYTIDETAPDAPTVTPAEDKVTVDIPDTGANGDADTVTVTFTPFEPKSEDAPKGDDQPVTVTFEKQPDGTWKPVGENADKADPTWVKDGGEGKGQVIEIPSDKLKPGSEVSATATDPAGNTSEAGKGTVPARFDFMVDAISEDDHLVDAKDATDGVAVTVTLPDNVAVGDKVVLTYTDPKGNVYKFNPPLAEGDNSTSTPTVDDKVSTTVDVPKDKNGNVIKDPITIVIPKEAFDAATSKDPAKPDASIKVELQDKDGHVKTDVKQPEPQKFAVDSVAPPQPSIEVTDTGFEVTLQPKPEKAEDGQPSDDQANKDAQPGDQTTITVTGKDGNPTTYTYEKGEDGSWKPTGENAKDAPAVTGNKDEGYKVSVPADKGATIKAEATDDAGNSLGEVTAAKPETTVDGVKVGGDGYINADEAKGNVPVEVTVNKAAGEEPTVTVKVGDKSYPATETGKTADGKAIYTAQVPAKDLTAAAGADNDGDPNKGQVTAEVSVTKDGVTAPVGDKQADYTIDTTAPDAPTVAKGETEGKPTLDVTLPTDNVNKGDTVTITVKDKDGKETPITVTKTDEGWTSSDETNYPVKEGKVSIPADQGTTVKAQAQDPAGNTSKVADGFVPNSTLSGTVDDGWLNKEEWSKADGKVNVEVKVKLDPSENITPTFTIKDKEYPVTEKPEVSADGLTYTYTIKDVPVADLKGFVKASGTGGTENNNDGELQVPVSVNVTKDNYTGTATVKGDAEAVVDTVAPKFETTDIDTTTDASNVIVTLPEEKDAKTTTIDVVGKDNSKQTISLTKGDNGWTIDNKDDLPEGLATVDGGKVTIAKDKLQTGSVVSGSATDVAGNESATAGKPLTDLSPDRKLGLQIEGTDIGLSNTPTDKLVTKKDLDDDGRLSVKVMTPSDLKAGDVIYLEVKDPNNTTVSLGTSGMEQWLTGVQTKGSGSGYPVSYYTFTEESAKQANELGYFEVKFIKDRNNGANPFLTGDGTKDFSAKVEFFKGPVDQKDTAAYKLVKVYGGEYTPTKTESVTFKVDTVAPEINKPTQEDDKFVVDLGSVKNADNGDSIVVKVKDATGEKTYTYTKDSSGTWSSKDSGAPEVSGNKVSIPTGNGKVVTVFGEDQHGNTSDPQSIFTALTAVTDIKVAGDDVVNKLESKQAEVPVEVTLKVAEGETLTNVKVNINGTTYDAQDSGNKDSDGNPIYVAKVPGSELKGNTTVAGGTDSSKPDVTVTATVTRAELGENATGTVKPKTEDYEVNVNQIVPDVAAQKDGSVTVAMPTEPEAQQVEVKWTDEQGQPHTVTYTKGDKGWTSSEPNTLPSLDSHNVNDQGVFSVTLPKNDVKDGSHVTATVTKTTTDNNGGSDDAIANNDTPPSSLAVEINDGGDGKLSYDDLAADGTTGAKVYFDPAEFLANSSKTDGKFKVAVTSETGGRTEVKDYSVEFKQKGSSVLEGYEVTAKDKADKPVEVKFDEASGRFYFDVAGLKAPASEQKINVKADFSTEDKAIQGQATDESTRLKGMQITSIQVEDNRDQLYDYQVALVKSQISKDDLEKGTYTVDSLFRKQFSGTRDVTEKGVKFDDDTWEHISVHVEKGAPNATDYIGKNLKVSIVDATTGKQVEDLGTQTIVDGQTAYNFASKISLDDGKYKIKAEVVGENGKPIDDSSSKTSGEITVDTDLRVHSTTTENSPFSNVYDIGEKGYGARHERLTIAAELNASESQEDDFTGGSQALQIANLLSYIAANKEATNPIKIVKVDGERHVLMDEAGNILSFYNVSIAYRVTGNINMSTAPTSEDLMNKVGRWEQVDRSVPNGAKTSNGDDYLLVTAKNSANKDGSFNYKTGGYNYDDTASWYDSSWTKDGLSGMINGPTPYDSNDKLNGKVLEIDMAGGNDTIDAMMVMGKTAIYTDSKNALEGALSGDDTIHLARGIWSYGSPISVQAHNMGMAGDGDQAIYMGGGNDTFTISGLVLTYANDKGTPWTRPGGIYWAGNSPYSFKDSDKASLLFSSVRLDMGTGDDKVSIKGDIIADADMSVNHSNYFTLGAGNDTFTSGSLRDTYSKGRSSNVLDLGEGHDTVHIKGNIEGSTLIISKGSSDITVDGGVILRQSGEGEGEGEGEGDASMLLGAGKDVVNITGNVISKAGSTMDRYYNVISDNNPNGGNAKVVDGAWYKESQDVITSGQLKKNALTMFDLGHGDNQLTVGGNWENTSIYAGDGNDILEIKGNVDRVNIGGVNNTHGIYLGNGNNIIELRGNVNRADIVTGKGDDTLRIGKDFYNSTNAFNYVKLGDGNNEFEIGGIAHHVNFSSGTGNDRYSFEGNEAHNLWINTGAGDDDIFFGKRSTVQNGKDGKPNYEAEHDDAGTKVGVDYTDKLEIISVNLGDGNDVFHSGNIGGSTIKAGEDQTKSATATGNKDINIHGRAESVDIFTGTGNDQVTIDKDFYNSGARGIINLSGGDDVLTIGTSGLHPAQEYGLSADAQKALGVISVYNAEINLGAGNDTVTLNGGIGHDVKDNIGSATRDVIDLGDGNDNLAIDGTVFNTKIEAGNGNDNIYIKTLDFYRLNGETTTLSFRSGDNNVVIDKLTYTGGDKGTEQNFHQAFNIDVRFDGTEGGGFLRTNLKTGDTFNEKVKWTKSDEAKSLADWAAEKDSTLDSNAAAFKDHATGDKYYQYTYADTNGSGTLHIYVEDDNFKTNGGIL